MSRDIDNHHCLNMIAISLHSYISPQSFIFSPNLVEIEILHAVLKLLDIICINFLLYLTRLFKDRNKKNLTIFVGGSVFYHALKLIIAVYIFHYQILICSILQVYKYVMKISLIHSEKDRNPVRECFAAFDKISAFLSFCYLQ